MKKYLFLYACLCCLFLLIIGCHLLPNTAPNGNNGNEGNNGTSPPPLSTTTLFTAFGAEPFWSVRIAESGIVLTALGERIDTIRYPFVEAEGIVGRPKDFAHIFRVTDEVNPITIVFKKHYKAETCWCSDGMSDNNYEYDATVLLKDKIWMGCGRTGK